MTSIPRLSGMLRRLFLVEAAHLAQEAGVIQRQRVEVLDLLPTQGQETVDVPVSLGASKQVSARLIARKMSEEVVKRRREQLKKHAHKQCQPISPRQWELAQWVIMLTNVPPSLLAAGEAMALLRALANRTAVEAVERPGQGR